jgi:hypothetical protein
VDVFAFLKGDPAFLDMAVGAAGEPNQEPVNATSGAVASLVALGDLIAMPLIGFYLAHDTLECS